MRIEAAFRAIVALATAAPLALTALPECEEAAGGIGGGGDSGGVSTSGVRYVAAAAEGSRGALRAR
jgi:hypothetical protein